jgi:serine/threonine protein kinase/predicted Zn-dependent protease
MERRLRDGQSYRTEDCLAAHPELAADSDATLELLYFEYVLREELGQTLLTEDWYRRFPEQAIPLKKILQIHHGMSTLPVTTGPGASLDTVTPLRTVAQPKVPTPRRLSKYVLLEELGRGSMGVVYKAREPALDRVVALKVILAGPHAGPDQLVRVHREARAIARLQHPNIVQIHEIGEDDGRPFLCMEYVSGPGLDSVLAGSIEQGSLEFTPEAAARLVESLARAVHYAHQQGIIHRDLKPANILLEIASQVVSIDKKIGHDSATFNPQTAIPKIADFGLAKFLDSSANATQTGYLIGTPSFMAPEQADGRTDEVGPGVDIYALGVILYELLTGRVPFQAATVHETLELVRTAEPAPLRQLQPHLPRDLQTICLKCLAKEPGNRYATALALAEDLRRFLAAEPIKARPATLADRSVKWVKRRPVVAGLLAALVLAVVAGATGVIWQWQRAEQNAADFRQERDNAVEARRRAEHHLKSARESIDELSNLGNQLWSQPQTNATGKILLEKVLAFYQELLKDESKDPDIRLGTAQVCGQVADIRHVLGQLDRAVQVWQQQRSLLEGLLKDAPDNIQYRSLLSTCMRQTANVLRDMHKTQEAQGAYREAIKLGEQVLATAPTDSSYQVSLANTFLNMATVLSPRDHARDLAALYERAMDLIKLAVKTSPRNTSFEGELALCLETQGMFYWDIGQAAKAEEAVRGGIEIRKRQYELGVDRHCERYLGRAYSNLGLIASGRGQSEEAEKSYGRALGVLGECLKRYPHDVHGRQDLVTTRRRLAGLQEKLGNYHNAAEQYRQIVALDPKGALANNMLAWFLVACPDLSLRDGHEAVRLAKAAVAAQAEDGNIWNTLGVAYYRDGEHRAAIDALNKSMELRAGGDSYDWFFLAMAHWKLGNRDEARRWLAKGVEWLQLHETKNEELRRFQAEAQAVLNDTAVSVRSLEVTPSDS